MICTDNLKAIDARIRTADSARCSLINKLASLGYDIPTDSEREAAKRPHLRISEILPYLVETDNLLITTDNVYVSDETEQTRIKI